MPFPPELSSRPCRNQAVLFGGNPRYENTPLIGRGSPPPTVTGLPQQGWAEEFLSQVPVGEGPLPSLGWARCFTCPLQVLLKGPSR